MDTHDGDGGASHDGDGHHHGHHHHHKHHGHHHGHHEHHQEHHRSGHAQSALHHTDHVTQHWSSMPQLGSTGPLLDQVQNLTDDLRSSSAHSPSFSPPLASPVGLGAGSLPVSGDTAALMAQINSQMGVAHQIYEGGVAAAANAPHVSSAVTNQMEMIQNTLHATPEQLNHMNGMLGSVIAPAEVSNDIAHHDAFVQANNEYHRAVQADDGLG